ncbi:MAG: hypothetical protein NTZ16_05620 [Verrucomicrobia bacterium]|nr:hypothetical protein [Verrucomicrobiota bacterium]
MNDNAQNWPFEDPKNLAVFSTRQIVFGGHPIVRVTHDNDDGSWQFLEAETPSESDAVIVGLGEIVKLDPSVKELSNLPIGWQARRSNKTDAWKKSVAD